MRGKKHQAAEMMTKNKKRSHLSPLPDPKAKRVACLPEEPEGKIWRAVGGQAALPLEVLPEAPMTARSTLTQCSAITTTVLSPAAGSSLHGGPRLLARTGL